MMQKQSETQINAYTTIRYDIVNLVPCNAKIVLDVGCSDGTLGAFLKQQNPALEVDGVEINEDFCDIAKEKLNNVVQADLNKMSLSEVLPERNYDCIIFADVLEHLIDPETQLREAMRNLKPNGVVIISLPNIRHITALYSIFFKGAFPRNTRGLFDQTHLRWFTINDAINFINSSGLKIVEMKYNLRFLDNGNSLLNKITRKLLSRFASFYPIREFLTYQCCIKATKDTAS